MEGTLIDQDSMQVEVDNVMVDSERRFDEDSFVKVFGETSSRKQSQEPSTHSNKVLKSVQQEMLVENATR